MKWKNYFSGFEWFLISANIIIAVALLIFAKDYSFITWAGFIASISNTVGAILAAKRVISNYAWSAVASLLYGFVAFAYGNTGEWSLNWIYSFPMQIIGWRLWLKNKYISVETKGDAQSAPETVLANSQAEVKSKSLSAKQHLIIWPIISLSIIMFAWLISLPEINMLFYGKLYDYGFNKYLIDSFSTVCTIAALYMIAKQYRENWIMWISLNAANIILWCFYTRNNMMILTFAIGLTNAVYGFLQWRKTESEM